MKYLISLTIICSFKLQIAVTQTSNNFQIGIFSGGYIRQHTELVPPLYQNLVLYNIALSPKLGYNITNRLTLGVMGHYEFAKSTLGDAPSTIGGGYFVKYKFSKLRDSSEKTKRFVFFAEWQQSFFNGYYTFNEVLIPSKIYKPMNKPVAQLGFDFNMKKGFSIALSMGAGRLTFYKDNNPQLGEINRITPFGILTLQYNFGSLTILAVKHTPSVI
jgi:hypothetical protein